MARLNRSLLSVLLILSFFISLVPIAEAVATSTINLNFGGFLYNGKYYLGKKSIPSYTVDLGADSSKIDYWEVSYNGDSFSRGVGTLSGKMLTLTDIPNGGSLDVYQVTFSDPGHKISRTSDGKRWRTSATNPDTGEFRSMEFEGDCVENNGVSMCPGYLPATATDITNSGSPKANVSFPDWLRDSSGRAVTYSDRVPWPTSFYFGKQAAKDQSGQKLVMDFVDSNSIEVITGVDETEGLGGTIPISGGKSDTTGYGKIKVAKTLNGTLLEGEDFGYRIDFKNGLAETRNYRMPVNVMWKAKTYAYSATIRVYYKDDTPPPSVSISGDFDILPSSTINWGESFSLKPKNIVIPNTCTYYSHQYRFEVNGITTTSKVETSRTTSTSISYPGYPYNLAVGSNMISINVKTSCGESGWTATKLLTINSRPSNQAPTFSVGWTLPGKWTQSNVQTKVSTGTILDLVLLDQPAPTDPDNDPIEFIGFDFTNQPAWAQQIPSKYSAYTNGYQQIVMDTPGTYCAKGTMRDQFGASASRTACIEVTPPNPVPVIKYPSIIRENHPVIPTIHGNDSYSPIGRTIDHAKDIWVNRKSTYPTAGPQTVTLEVFDNTGLKSLQPASVTFQVAPDEPPIAAVEVVPLGIRNQTYDLINKSYSNDGDQVVSVSYRYKYDANNNGFNDDTWVNLTGNMTKATLKPTKVGKYQIEIKAVEDYGKEGTATAVLDTINQAPAVSFLIEGKNDQPAPAQTVSYSSSSIMGNWGLYKVNSNTPITNRTSIWSLDNSKLVGGLGRRVSSSLYPGVNRLFTQDYGYGNNSISPYLPMSSSDPAYSQPLPFPTSWNTPAEGGIEWTSKQIEEINTNNKYVYIHYDYYTGGTNYKYLFALNKSKIGRYSLQLYNAQQQLAPVHTWSNGNPYDFGLKQPDIKEVWMPYVSPGPGYSFTQQIPYFSTLDPAYVNKSGNSLFNYNKNRVIDYLVTDRTIYQLNDMQCSWNCTPQLDIVTYDALTGQKIASTMDNQIYFPQYQWAGQLTTYPLGDNLLLHVDGNHGNDIFIVFDRKGNKVSHKVIPKRSDPRTGANGGPVTWTQFSQYGGMVVQDSSGDLYRLYHMVCNYQWTSSDCPNYGVYTEYYLEKIDVDTWTKPWTIPLGGNHPWSWPFCPTSGIIFSCAVAPDPENVSAPLVVNSEARQIILRHFSQNQFGHSVGYQVVNMDTGYSVASDLSYSVSGSSFYITPNGSYVRGTYVGPFAYTPDGSANGLLSRAGPNGNYKWTAGGTVNGWMNGPNSGCLQAADPYYPTNGYYIGDGLYLSFHKMNQCGYVDENAKIPWITKGTPVNSTATFKPTDLGQFVSTDVLDHADLEFTMRMRTPQADTYLAGLSFRMSDPMNRYAVETNGTTLYLSRYVNGIRTVLASQSITIQADTDYSFTINMQANRIQVSLGGVPYFDVTDNTFASGKFGPFSEKPYTEFSMISRKQITLPTTEWLTSYSIWDGGTATAEVRVSGVTFTDPENDPRAGNNQWKIEHTPKFLNNQGVSVHNGKTFTSPILSLDKVGNYRVTLKAMDDPNSSYLYPSNVFDSYRKLSNEYWQLITVHRRPIASYSLSTAADGTVLWNDSSYDPDRWLSASSYSTENTGINYQTTRGILERKYFYVTPSGSRVNLKLVTPAETGIYTVGLQVKDEYGAWSTWNEQQITIGKLAPPNSSPVAGFTVTPSTGYRGQNFTITSTASDSEDGSAAKLSHEYYIRNLTEGSGETLQSTNRGAWTKTFSSLGVMEIRQVVTDSKGQTAQAVKTVTVVNRAPTADFTWIPNPVWEGDSVTFYSIGSDADNDPISYQWVIRDSTGNQVYTAATANVQYRFIQPGDYRVTLEISDGFTTSTKTSTVRVSLLRFEPDVMHTPEWLNYHLEKGHQTTNHPKPFFSGEQFVLSALTSDAAITEVVAWIDMPGIDGKQIYVETALARAGGTGPYQGVLYDPVFASLTKGVPVGSGIIHFRIQYANGVKKTVDIPFEIIGHVLSTFNVHRRH